MKLHIAFETPTLKDAITTAHEVEQYADIFEVGSLLIASEGVNAVTQFRNTFPDKTLIADTKILDRQNAFVDLFAQADPDWITVMAGTSRAVIHQACNRAQQHGQKVLLSLLDSSSLGQSALEAKSLGVDALLYHKPVNTDQIILLDEWEMVRGNTDLPIYVSTPIMRENVHDVLQLNPAGIIVSNAITQADNPEEEAKFFYNLMK